MPPRYSSQVQGGFPRPILHELCTLGHACVALVRSACDWDADRIRELAVRFTAPVFPGETIRTQVWRDAPGERAEAASRGEAGAVVSFRSRVVERDAVVLDHGYARLA